MKKETNLSNPNQKKPKKFEAFLFGPFLGELSWEFYRFAPYAIHLKKHNPDKKVVVLTRKDRFGLYGIYADILIPLRIQNDANFSQVGFGLENYRIEFYDTLKKYFFEKYSKRFEIIDHFCPLIHSWYKNIRWQFPRNEMDYDFQSQKKVCDAADSIIRETDVIVDYDAVGFIDVGKYKEVEASDLFKDVTIDVVIEALRRCEFVIGNLKHNLSHLGILLKKPLVSLNETLSDDSISLLNPLRTPIFSCQNIKEGVEIYEDNLRPEKSGSWKQRRFIYFSQIR